MKKDSRVLLSAAIALLVLSGCKKTAVEDEHKLPPGGTTATIVLDVDDEISDVAPGQTLEFVLKEPKPNDTYWVQFVNGRNPCELNSSGDPNTYSGSTKLHPSCKTKPGKHTKYAFAWGLGDPASKGIILFDVIKCRPSCE